MRASARRTRRSHPVVALLAAAAIAEAAFAQTEGRSIRTEGEFLAYDAAARTVKVKVTKPGSGAEANDLKAGQEVLFKVKPEGSVLSRTTVAIQGVKAELSEIAAGRTVNVYWRPDESDPKARFARKIDVVLSDEELDKRYGTE